MKAAVVPVSRLPLPSWSLLAARLADLVTLMKPRVTSFAVLTALVGLMQGPARTVKTTAGALETGASSHTKPAGEHDESCTSAGALDDVGRRAAGPASTERSKSMSAVSNFATFVPGTKTPGSKHREILPFPDSLL